MFRVARTCPFATSSPLSTLMFSTLIPTGTVMSVIFAASRLPLASMVLLMLPFAAVTLWIFDKPNSFACPVFARMNMQTVSAAAHSVKNTAAAIVRFRLFFPVLFRSFLFFIDSSF